MGQRINTIMQACFFAISNILPKDQAIAEIKNAIKKTYSKKGDAIVQKNFEAVDASLAHMHEVKYPDHVTSTFHRLPPVPANAPEFVQKVTGEIIADRGNELPVSAFEKLLTALGRPARPSMKNAASQPKFRFGIPKPAFSAANARWSARTALSA